MNAIDTSGEIQEVARLLSDLAHARFFGALEIKMEAGRIMLVRKIENLKVGDNGWNNHRKDLGGDHERR